MTSRLREAFEAIERLRTEVADALEVTEEEKGLVKE